MLEIKIQLLNQIRLLTIFVWHPVIWFKNGGFFSLKFEDFESLCVLDELIWRLNIWLQFYITEMNRLVKFLIWYFKGVNWKRKYKIEVTLNYLISYLIISSPLIILAYWEKKRNNSSMKRKKEYYLNSVKFWLCSKICS